MWCEYHCCKATNNDKEDEDDENDSEDEEEDDSGGKNSKLRTRQKTAMARQKEDEKRAREVGVCVAIDWAYFVYMIDFIHIQ